VYQWWVFVHLIGVFGFLIAHGTSVGVLFRLRNERDPARVNALLQLSSASIQIFYGSLVVLLAGGFIAAFTGHLWATGGWLYAAIAVLVLTSVTMLQMARPYYRRAAFVARAMASGSQAVTDEQFDAILRSGRAHAISTVGIVGLGVILYLMVWKPTLGVNITPAAAAPSGAACSPAGASLTVSAQNTAFDTRCLAAPANTAFTIAFTNKDALPHNVAIYTNASASTALFKGSLLNAPGSVTYDVKALPAGTYVFRCDVHPAQMTGVFVVK